MRRLVLVGLTVGLAGSCAGPDPTSPTPPGPGVIQAEKAALRPKEPPVGTAPADWRAALDDAVDRLAPALGPAGTTLTASFVRLRDASREKLDAQRLAATSRLLNTIAPSLGLDFVPEADALRVTLDALAALDVK